MPIEAERLTFYAAMARARRLGSINPCGMFRRIVQTTAYHRYIADCDEDQARAWLAGEQLPSLNTTDARDLLRRIVETANGYHHLNQADDKEDYGTVIPGRPSNSQPEDSITARYLTHWLQQAGFPIHDAFNLIMTTHDGRKCLAGWTRDRWDRPTSTK